MTYALVFAGLGCVLGTALDWLHAWTGVLRYTPASMGIQAWWVPPLFAGSGLAMGYGYRLVAVRLSGNSPPVAPSAAELALGTLAFVGSYGSSGYLQAVPWVALALYVAMFAAGVALTPSSMRPPLLLHAAGAFVAGPAVEASLSALGLFGYTHPDLLGFPLWLPGIYLNAAWASAAVDRALTSRA